YPPAPAHRRQAPTTGNQVVWSAQAEAEIDHVTTANVRAGRAQVSHQFGRRSGFLQGVSQHGQPVRVEFAVGELALIVCGTGKGDDGGCALGRDQADGAEVVAEDTA